MTSAGLIFSEDSQFFNAVFSLVPFSLLNTSLALVEVVLSWSTSFRFLTLSVDLVTDLFRVWVFIELKLAS